ncbi:MAG: sigma-54-dependent Fis family transcriptional regulator [Verrucomicrobia bacterium]|nr:sigma-54-dependent Fis family transcriptional regulator [Verrucomicrobiota bacterium]
MNERILVVDDEADIRALLSALLARASYDVIELEDAAGLRQAFTGAEPSVILLDLKLPDAEGLDLLPAIKKQWPDVEVIVLTGNASLEAAVMATKLGAYDFQKKPFETKSVMLSVERALEHRRLREEATSLRQVISTMSGQPSPIFQSPAMKSAVRTVERVAPTDVSVLITGESGTGKEVIADLLHTLSLRNKGPFIKINCAALPRELIESELFGSVKGAFTGAQADRDGLFRQAEGGTLLLDELSEMPIDTQSKLLRVLQEKEVRPVGGRTSYHSDVRIIAATNREIEQAIEGGKLREDLYYRISAISISLPPLRERREDILPLATAFLKRFSAQANRVINAFSPEATEKLLKFDWPGNVRQLQNEIQRAVLLCEGSHVQATELSITHPTVGSEGNAGLFEAMERSTILRILNETKGNKQETARRLGIGRQTLYNKMKAYGITL